VSDHDALRDNAGPWVLGALDEEEAWRFAAHLDVCNACRAEVQSLRSAAEALPLAAPPTDPPPELKARLMAIVEAEARERKAATDTGRARGSRPSRAPWRDWLSGPAMRPAFAAGLAGLVLVLAGGAIGFLVHGNGSPSVRTQALVVDRTKAPGATASIVRSDAGTEVRVANMPPPARVRVYEVWIQRDGQAPEADALFSVNRHGRGAVALLGALKGASRVMITDEPAGGSTVPSRQPVLVSRAL
jgi:anti-sigma-K factor RskA